MVQTKVTWVVVLDGAYARVFERQKKRGPLIQIMNLQHTHEPSRNLGHDKPGRVFESAVIGKHAYEPKISKHEKEKQSFGLQICDTLIDAFKQKKFQTLYVVCPTKMKGLIRKRLAKEPMFIKEGECIEITKDLVSFDKHALEDVLLSTDDYGDQKISHLKHVHKSHPKPAGDL